jgi:hypothetical protein
VVKIAREAWLTTSQVGRILGCTDKWVLKLVEDEKIPATPTPHGFIFHPLAILRVRQRRADEGKQPPPLDERHFPAEVLEAFYQEMKGDG